MHYCSNQGRNENVKRDSSGSCIIRLRVVAYSFPWALTLLISALPKSPLCYWSTRRKDGHKFLMPKLTYPRKQKWKDQDDYLTT